MDEGLKISDLFFMYALIFAHEAFGKNTPILVKLMNEEASKNKMDNFNEFLTTSKINPFKLMFYFDEVKNKKIKLVYSKGGIKFEVDNPNGLFTKAFYNNIESKFKVIFFDRLLNKSSIRVLDNPEPEPEPDIEIDIEKEKKNIIESFYGEYDAIRGLSGYLKNMINYYLNC